MKIDIEKLDNLVAEADKIFFTPEGEAVLEQLLDIQAQVELAIDTAKEKLEKAAIKLDPNFSSIQGEKIKVSYRYFGSRYYLDDSLLAEIEPELYTTTTKHTVNPSAVDKWTLEHKGMPLGIKEVERKKSIVFQRKGDK